MPDIALWSWCDQKCMMCSNPIDFRWTNKFYSFQQIKTKIDSYIKWEKVFDRFFEDTDN